MMEIDDPDFGINNMERKLEHLQEMFCETIYDDVMLGNKVDMDDLEEALRYFTDKEEYEKCIVLKKALSKLYKNKTNVKTD